MEKCDFCKSPVVFAVVKVIIHICVNTAFNQFYFVSNYKKARKPFIDIVTI